MPNIATSELQQVDGLKVLSSQKLEEVKPELIVVSGIHGDETAVVPELFFLLMQYKELLPPWVYAPVMSQLAAEAGTRTNPDGIDMNRSFAMEPPLAETATAQKFMRLFGPARTLLSVHQDRDLSRQTYVYAEGKEISRQRLNAWRKKLFETGHTPLADFDDKDDEALRMLARDGYIYHPHSAQTPQMFESWAVNNGLAEQAITLEVPSRSTSKEKYQILKASLELVMIGK